MVSQNPTRLEFYEKYKTIIAEYNAGKDIQAVQKAFDDLNDFVENEMRHEEDRAIRKGLDEETLAIYDLLKKATLSQEEEAEVKQVARKTLARLKQEKLKIDRWRQSIQIKAQVQTMILDSMQYLPQASYPDAELADKSLLVYQHVYSNYQGAGMSTYGGF
jgi:type I restriction enzyme R subunit